MKFHANFPANFLRKISGTKNKICAFRLHYFCTVLYIRTTHTHIIRAYFVYTRMSIRAHTRVYVPLLYIIPISFFIWSIVSQTKHYFYGIKKGKICILCYLIFRVFDHFANSPTNYRFFDTCLVLLKLRKLGRKLKQSLEVPILTHELYVFTSKDLCFGMCRQVVCVMFLALLLKIDLCQKNDISVYIWLRSFIQTVKYSLLCEKIIYQSFHGAPFTFSGFFSKEKFCVSTCTGKTCEIISYCKHKKPDFLNIGSVN